jgi:hypothetical protein
MSVWGECLMTPGPIGRHGDGVTSEPDPTIDDIADDEPVTETLGDLDAVDGESVRGGAVFTTTGSEGGPWDPCRK